MRFCVIGDIHGRDFWKDFIEENKGSHFIFLGDYCDPYDEDIGDSDALENLKFIIDYKKSQPGNVTLLIGNHDMQYIYYPEYPTSRIRSNKKLKETIDVFQENKELFQIAYQKGSYLFIHAGVSVHWFDEFERYFDRFGFKRDKSNLAEVLNKMYDIDLGRKFLMMISSFRGGEHEISGPLWVDKRELEETLENIHQYVGHNIVQNIWTKGDKTGSITFCDVLSSRKKCLIIDI